MNLITSQNDIAAASTADLVATYNALTGKSIKKFENRGIAEARVSMAILNSEFDAGKAGVAKGAKPKAAPKNDIAAKKASTKSEKPEAPAAAPVKSPAGLHFKGNGLAAQLLAASAGAAEKRTAAKAAPKAATVRRPKNQPERMLVTLTESEARSKLQADSNRAHIIAELRSAKGKQMTVLGIVDAMSKKLGAKDVDAALTKLSNLGWVKLTVIEPRV